MKPRKIVIGCAIAVTLGILALLGSLYSIYLWIRPSGIVKIDARAVDHGDYILVDMRVANIDTTRCLSNFCFTFLSYSSDAHTVSLRHALPDAIHTNYCDNWSDLSSGVTHVFEFDPHVCIGDGESITMSLLLTSVTTNHPSVISGTVQYRGKRIVGAVHPLDNGCVLFKIPVEYHSSSRGL